MVAKNILVNASFAPSLINFRGKLLKRLVSAGHRVHVSAPSVSATIDHELRSLGVIPHQVRLSRTGIAPIQDARYFAAVRNVIAREKIDTVLGYTIKPCVYGSLAAQSLGRESYSLVTGAGYAFLPKQSASQRLISKVSQLLWRLATRANTKVIFQNPDDLEIFLNTGALLDRPKARLVNGSGVDLTHFREQAPRAARPSFLMISRLLPHKGVREYAEAAIALLEEGLDAEFKLGGYFDEGPASISREEVVRWQRHGLNYLGPLDDVRPALGDSDVFVLPSYAEGTPRTVLEAMAVGRPVVTSDAPGCRETVIEGRNGFLVQPRDVEGLKAAMLGLARDEELRKRMGQASLQICRDKFDVVKVNDQMVDILGLG